MALPQPLSRRTPPATPRAAGGGVAAMAEMAACSEPELVARARQGDDAARDELARRCRRPAYLLALQLLRDPDDALDVAQDALLRVFTHLDRFQPGRAVQPWLATIVRNRACDLLRRRQRRPVEPLEGDGGETRREVIDHAPGPEATAAERQLQARVWRALGELAEPHREILVLRDYQDLSYEEIAHVLGVPLGTVMSRLHRARRALRELLVAAGWPAEGRDDG
jgi:RNA polymerase sigma-70 factor, ECF subfamily